MDIRAFIDESADWTQLNNGIPQRAAYVTLLKGANLRFQQAFKDGIAATQLVRARSELMDRVLLEVWQGFGLKGGTTVALVAVGGYGRAELHPHSDVDLMLLVTDSLDASTEAKLSSFITFLWDIGLEVGHSVRTLADCVTQGAADITIATNLMESRRLAGSNVLYLKMADLSVSQELWSSRAFFEAKLKEQRSRYLKFDETAYKLEPNVKEGPGGLRDIQMIGWVAKRHLNVTKLHDLVEFGFLTEEEHISLLTAQDHLWRVRLALHFLNGRREDRLLFDYQRTLAKEFGYEDKNHNLAVEQFMQSYFRTVIEVQRLNEMLLQHYEEAILYADETDTPTPINRRFQVRKGYLEVTHEKVYQRHPSALLETFLLMQQQPELKGVRASTIRLIRRHRNLIDQKFRQNIVNRSLFMEILRQPVGIFHELKRMNRYGVLAAYWPSFAMIVGRMQYDLFHVYTVDEHTLIVLRNVRRFADEKYASEQPLRHALFKRLPKPELLYLAALFHDIGKGRGGDHSHIGAGESTAFCLEHGLSQYDADLVSWLVSKHLIMSMTAQREDLSDPKVIHRFAETVGSLSRLDYLYLLTVADIRGTSPTLWNGWKDALLLELYHSTRRVLRRGLDNPLATEELLNEIKQSALKRLSALGITPSRCLALWEDFDEAYFLGHSPDEICWQTQAILSADHTQLPLVKIRRQTEKGCSEIFVFVKRHNRLFAHITAALTQLGLNVMDARITSAKSGYKLDTFLVLDESGQSLESEHQTQEVEARLQERLRDPDQPLPNVTRMIPRQLRHFQVGTQIEFFQDSEKRQTVVELVTQDDPGLLAKVAQVFLDQGLIVHKARISTIGEQVEDLFYITDLDRKPIRQADLLNDLRTRIVEKLGLPPKRQPGARLAG